MRVLLLGLAVLCSTIAFASGGDNEYSVSAIPLSLLKDANAVLRRDEWQFEISSFTKSKLYHKYAVTILNEKGDDFSYFAESYDKFRSVHSIEGTLYDANGKKLSSLKNKDVQDRSGTSDISLMEDNRVKLHSFYYRVYPYTVEYEVVTEYNNTLMFMPWMPQSTEHLAVEQSSYSVQCPSWFSFRYKMLNYPGEPVVSETGDKKSYVWQVTKLPAVVKEFACPDFPYLTTCVFFSPDKFELGGYKGSAGSWQELGQFQLQLNQGRDVLPEAVKQKVHAITDGVADPREKIRLLYEFLQKNTRYISIQLGIGGLQPFDATYVATKAYGDCKALTNYMYSLLKEVNIKSCYTQIRAGEGQYFFLPDFASDQFDHIILCVPLQNDTMWLECTSQTLAAGYLGGFTCNRYALAIDENGGKLIHTPVYTMADNIELRKVKGTLADDGTLDLHVNTMYKGLKQDWVEGLITNLSKDKIKEYLHQELDFATYDISDFAYQQNKAKVPEVTETLSIVVSNYATATGRRLFVLPNVMNRSYRKLPADSARKYDLDLGYAYQEIDSVELELPKGYESEAMPQDVSVESKFGKYNSSVKLKDNKLYYYRSMQKYTGHFPAKDYGDLVKFYDAIYKADRGKVVFVKNEKQEDKKAF